MRYWKWMEHEDWRGNVYYEMLLPYDVTVSLRGSVTSWGNWMISVNGHHKELSWSCDFKDKSSDIAEVKRMALRLVERYLRRQKMDYDQMSLSMEKLADKVSNLVSQSTDESDKK